MKVQKTIKCKITSLTERKREVLEREYNNLQRYLHENEDVDLYSANKQQAERYWHSLDLHGIKNSATWKDDCFQDRKIFHL